MKKTLISLALLFFATTGFAQKWKEYLDSAAIYKDQDNERAITFYQRSLEALPADSSGSITYAQIAYDFGRLKFLKQNYKIAEKFSLQAYQIQTKIWGKENSAYALTNNLLGAIYAGLNDNIKAESFYLESLRVKEKVFGKEHSEYLKTLSNLANFYKAQQQFEKAEPLYIEAKNLREKMLSKEHSDYVNSLNNLASLYIFMKKYEKAEPLYSEAKNIREKMLGKAHPDYITSLNNLGSLYYIMGLYKKAELFYLDVKNIREKTLGKEHPDYVTSLNNLGTLYFIMGLYEKAEPFYLDVKNIREKILGKAHPDYAASIENLGAIYHAEGQYEKAEVFYLEAKIILEKALRKEHPDYATACNSLGTIYQEKGQYQKAEVFYLEAKIILEKALGKEHPDYVASINNLGTLYYEMGQYDKAEPFLMEAKNRREKILGKTHPDYASSCDRLAAVYQEKGQYEKAEIFYLEAKNIREKVLGKAHPDYGNSLNNLADLYQQMGQYEKAETLYIKAKNIVEKALGKRHAFYANTLRNLAAMYGAMGQYQKAESLYLEAKSITEKLLGKEHPDYAAALNNLANLYQSMGQYEKAEPLNIEAKNIREKVLGKAHPDYAASLNNLAALYDAMGQYEKAEPLNIEAKNIREKVLGKAHPDYTASLNNLATLYWHINKPLKADSFYKEAFNIKYHQVKKILQFTGEKEKAAFIKNIIGSNDFYNSFYYQSYSHAAAAEPFAISFLSRNLILSSSQQLKKSINSSTDSNLLNDYEKWTALKKQLAVFYSKGKNGAYAKNLEDSADILEKILALASSAFKNVQADKAWQDIQQSLKANETAIEFSEFNYFDVKRWTDSTFYLALVLRKDKPEPVLVPLFEKRQLDSILLSTGNKTTNDNVKSLYASRGVEGDESVVINKSLYNLVWKPIENELQGINTVYFAPAGLLHRIAFAALPVNDKKVLSDNYKLVELSTTALIIDQQPVYISASDKINLYGGIKYNVDTTALKASALSYHLTNVSTRSLPDDLSRGSAWNDLPGTKKETDGIISVASNKNNISVLSGIQATEESIKALDGKNSPVVLHIATHGFFFPDPNKENKKDNLQTTENGKAFKQSDDPLFRSGLLFAGANNSWSGKAVEGIEDGILTSYEVSNMYLPNTKLVVLSACETGLGDIQGAEGVYGLQRAFKMAGVQNLVMSLWKVPDAETAEFMQEFYKKMFTKQSIADAFYNAQTTMKNKYRSDPYKWAAWVLVR